MKYYIAACSLEIKAGKAIQLKPFVGKYFITPIILPSINLKGIASLQPANLLEGYNLVFSGQSFDDVQIPYDWFILKKKEIIAIQILFQQHEIVKEATAIINPKTSEINLYFEPIIKSKPLVIDPLSHPLGSLIYVYMAHLTGGILIHASGVELNTFGRIFTAVSGTGKSTMAGLWKNYGASVVNDDRLWLQKIEGKWYMFNTPMAWYADKPKIAAVNEIFLIRQSPNNELEKIEGISAAMRVMSNCIQHFYDKQMTSDHLDLILDITRQVPVYTLGFKPDKSVVEMLSAL
ncbi:hypothetical protein ACT3CD_07485 [Geofilum sp. OHC36d9]|uniref:hypothetical protein n=1 Tax=Geofilum sp. OHC36d9 TaxID=3458413 RepID=UPI0040346521